MKKLFMSLVSVIAGLVLFVSPVFAASFTNGGFENLPVAGSFDTLSSGNVTGMPGWTVASGNVDHIGNYWVGSLGQSIDLNGLEPGSISQEFTTVPGNTYNVTFDLSGNPDSISDENHPYWSPSDKIVRVSATGIPFVDYNYDTAVKANNLSDMNWENNVYSFVATGASTVLTFASQIPGAFGPAIDNVVIEEITPTPTPNLPINKDQCKKDGWKSFGVFKNQGDCVSFVVTGGKNLPAGN